MHRKNVAAIVLASLLSMGCSTAARNSGNPVDVAAIRQVVESFRVAIAKKDKANFMSLFFSGKPEQITWQAVVDDPGLERIKLTRPEAIKARYRPDNNFVAFIEGIVASKTNEEETFSDIQIDTDGEVASVSFDYTYLSGGKMSNYGREKWLLVRTEPGWKIISVVYTIRQPKPEGGG